MTSHAHRSGAPDHVTDYLPAYLNGTLAEAGPDTPTPESIAVHLQECPACRQELAAWTAIAEAIPPISATATPASPTPGTLAALMAAIDAPAWQRTWPERPTPVQTRSEGKMADPVALQQPMPVERRHWTRASGLGLIAAVLILIATVAIIFAPEPESDPPRLPAIAAASPDATATSDSGAPSPSVQIVPEAIDIAECTTEPRPPGTVAQMREASRSTPEIGLPRSSQANDWSTSLAWPEPDPETRSSIEATLRQLVACRFWFLPPGSQTYDLDNRYLALFSDRYVVGMAIEMEGSGFRLPFSPYNSAPLAIVDISEHEDGRVLVSLGDLPGFSGTVFVLFEKQNDAWVIDDWGDIRFDQTRVDPRMPASLTVIATDEVGQSWQEPWDAPLPAGTEFTLTVANLGGTSLRFEMPGLIGATDVAAGHSVDLRVIAPPGTYALDAMPEGGEDLVDDAVTFQPNPDAAATPEPKADATDTATASPYVRIRSQDETVDISECITKPRLPGTVDQLRAAHGGTPEPGFPTPNPHLTMDDFFDPTLDGAEPAPETIAAVESTLRQVVACRFEGIAPPGATAYDLDSRYLALFSDRYVAELAMEMEGDTFRLPFLPLDSAPLPIIAAAERPEGVLIRLGGVPGYGEQTVHLLMVQEHGRWVIDDWENFIVCASPASAPQRAPRATGMELPPVLPVVATDGLALLWQMPQALPIDAINGPTPRWQVQGDAPLLSGTDVILTVANLGEEPIRFEISGLGFATDIAAGHSIDLVVNAPAGTYPLILDRPGIPDMLDADLTLEPAPGGTPIPKCSP